MTEKHTFYHATTTGRNHATLASFRTQGVVVSHGFMELSRQLDGFFVNSCREYQEKDAADFRGLAREEGGKPGDPLIVTVRAALHELTPDFEHPTLPLAALRQSLPALTAIKPGAVHLAGRHSIREISETRQKGFDGLRIITQGQPGKLPFPHQRTYDLFIPWDRDMKDPPDWLPQARLLEIMRSHLMKHDPDYAARERNIMLQTMRAADAGDIDAAYAAQFKIRGKAPKVEKLEVLDMQGQWHDVTVVEGPVQGPSLPKRPAPR